MDIIFDGKKYKSVENKFLTGMVEDRDDKNIYKPNIVWKKKINYETWCKVVSYFHASMEKFGAEVQVSLFYDDSNDTWLPWAFPQETGGMTTQELKNHPDRNEQMKQFPGMVMLGTIHHHCNVSAFQSGTDHKDEINHDGIHITLGNLDNDIWDFHGRIVYEETMHVVNDVTDLVEIPEMFKGAVQKDLPQKVLLSPIDHKLYPDVWMTNVKEPKPVRPSHLGYGYQYPSYKPNVPFHKKTAKEKVESINTDLMEFEEAVTELSSLIDEEPFYQSAEIWNTEEEVIIQKTRNLFANQLRELSRASGWGEIDLVQAALEDQGILYGVST